MTLIFYVSDFEEASVLLTFKMKTLEIKDWTREQVKSELARLKIDFDPLVRTRELRQNLLIIQVTAFFDQLDEHVVLNLLKTYNLPTQSKERWLTTLRSFYLKNPTLQEAILVEVDNTVHSISSSVLPPSSVPIPSPNTSPFMLSLIHI